jgi:flagellar hook protein FlgE
MQDMIDFSQPLAGMQSAESTVNRVATKVASSGFNGDQVDLSQEAVSLMSAQNDFASNVKVVQTMDEMNQSLLDITV